MTIVLYLDVFQGQTHYWATSNPPKKLDGTRRFKIEVDVPDLNEPDDVIGSKTSEVKGE